jgi:hypothetical protein
MDGRKHAKRRQKPKRRLNYIPRSEGQIFYVCRNGRLESLSYVSFSPLAGVGKVALAAGGDVRGFPG